MAIRTEENKEGKNERKKEYPVEKFWTKYLGFFSSHISIVVALHLFIHNMSS
jgi:hypothetical protein